MKLKISILIAALAWLMASCLENEIVYDSNNKDYRAWEISGTVATIHVPLYKTMKKHFNFEELFVDYDNDRLVCIRYAHSEKMEWSDDIYIRSFTGSGSEWTLPFTSSGGAITQSHTSSVRLNSSGESDSYVKVAELKSGVISIILNGTNNLLSGNIRMTIPELKKDGVEFTRVINLPASAELTYVLDEGYRIETTDTNHEINVRFDINATGTVNSIPLTFRIYDVDATYLSGYFGEVKETANGEMEFDFFDELDFEGAVGIREIKIDAVANNYTGMPVKVKADLYYANEGTLNEKLELLPPFDFTVPAATESGSNHTISSAEKTFSTILPVIEFESENYPTVLKFDVERKSNPDGEVENFIVKNKGGSSDEVEFTLTVPLYVMVEKYSRQDTIKFDYNDIFGNDADYSNNVEYININLKVNNRLPFEATLEATVINEDGSISIIILPGREILINQVTEIFIPLDKNLLKSFENNDVKKIILKTTGKTSNEGYVKVKDTDFLDISVSVDAKANIPSNL